MKDPYHVVTTDELIEELKKYPKNTSVFFHAGDGYVQSVLSVYKVHKSCAIDIGVVPTQRRILTRA